MMAQTFQVFPTSGLPCDYDKYQSFYVNNSMQNVVCDFISVCVPNLEMIELHISDFLKYTKELAGSMKLWLNYTFKWLEQV